jgi:steroid delta-isomerase-like uncharacterized protein
MDTPASYVKIRLTTKGCMSTASLKYCNQKSYLAFTFRIGGTLPRLFLTILPREDQWVTIRLAALFFPREQAMIQSQQNQVDARISLVQAHLQAENKHDLDAVIATFGKTPRFIVNGLQLNDAQSIRALYEGFGFGGRGGLSDVAAEVTQQHVSGESIVVEMTFRGKHTGIWQGIPATNREFEIPACAVFDFDAEGKIASERVYFDGALLLRQLGVLP